MLRRRCLIRDYACTQPRAHAIVSCSGAGGGVERCAAAVADAMRPARARRTARADRLDLGVREVRAAAVEALVLGHELRPVSARHSRKCSRVPGPQVQHVRPDPARARLARGAHDRRELLGRSEMPGRIGAIPTDAVTPASTSR